MWIEKLLPRSKDYIEKESPSRTYFSSVYITPETKKLRRKYEDLYKCLKVAHGILEYTFASWEKEVPKHEKFGISLEGIKVTEKEISIDPRKLKPNVFYLFSYKDEKYVARKSDNNVVEIYEVME